MLGKLKKRKRLRTHGFLQRSITANGRKVLRARRQKGRHELAPSYPVQFKATKGKSKMHIVAGGSARIVTAEGGNERFRKR